MRKLVLHVEPSFYSFTLPDRVVLCPGLFGDPSTPLETILGVIWDSPVTWGVGEHTWDSGAITKDDIVGCRKVVVPEHAILPYNIQLNFAW